MEGRCPWSEAQLAWGPERDSLEKRGSDWARGPLRWRVAGTLRESCGEQSPGPGTRQTSKG